MILRFQISNSRSEILHKEGPGEVIMETLLKDSRYGIRSLLKRPSFTAIAVISYAKLRGFFL